MAAGVWERNQENSPGAHKPMRPPLQRPGKKALQEPQAWPEEQGDRELDDQSEVFREGM